MDRVSVDEKSGHGNRRLLFTNLLVAATEFGIDDQFPELRELSKQELVSTAREAMKRGFMSGLPAVYEDDFGFGIDVIFEIAKNKGVSLDDLRRTEDEWEDLIRLLRLNEFTNFWHMDVGDFQAENFSALGEERAKVLREWAHFIPG